MTAKGKLLINSPDDSGKKTSGINAMIKVTVQPKTAFPIWFVALRVASLFVYPSLSQRSIFSTTTMLSSTNNPKATTKPTILSWFKLKPKRFNITIPMASDNGIDIITTEAARKPNGSKVMPTKRMAIKKSFASPPNLLFTFTA